jgi:hypothetical protein
MLIKTELLNAIAAKNRGILASPIEKQAILSCVAQLEDRNPTPNPLEAGEILEGNWRLLYTTSQELLRLDQFPLIKLGDIYQFIRINTNKIYNVAELYGFPYLEGIVSVAARFTPTSNRRVQVKFERGIVGAQRLIPYRSVSTFVQDIEAGKKFLAIDFPITSENQQGWLEVTYLDEELRIGRGNEGSVFVLAKAP